MFPIPQALNWMEASVDGRVWLRELPSRVTACVENWRLRLEAPYEHSYVSLVLRVSRPDGSPAVLKIQYPHRESDHEQDALRLWSGNGAVQLFDYDAEHHALLIERCEPGEHLSTVRADEALDVLSHLLPRLWIPAGAPFTSLSDEAETWIRSLPAEWGQAGRPFEVALLDDALDSLERLRGTQGEPVLLHQDLHADNILRAAREPWLAIDPKPLVGEREFSLAPIIRSYELGHSRALVVRRLDNLAAQLHLDRERARLWALAQTLAWSFGGESVTRHVETARWLWHA
ncbi:MAG TPA: aminoglycoside phosphotransferase family protein [Gemmatimonadaceae bacterium]|jgi:streptomycin 6-kinase